MEHKTYTIIAETKAWIEKFVIFHELCPFAKTPFKKGKIRYKVVLSGDEKELYETLLQEFQFLLDVPSDQIETTLIIHPNLFTEFLEYNDFLGLVEEVIEQSGLEGYIQVASFHPDYQFEGTFPNESSNKTNQSPFPMLHLLREDILEMAIDAYGDTSKIPERNMELMEKLFGKYHENGHIQAN